MCLMPSKAKWTAYVIILQCFVILFFVFYWSIVDLQCSVNFKSTAKLVPLNWQYVNIEDNIFYKKYNILSFQISWFGIGTALDE